MSSPVNVGDILAGKYQVERVLGVGGMGVVVAARHLTLGERVAIKFLLPQALAREDVVKRFIKEGQAAARLRSEHVTRVHDVGKLETGAPFLVMEYLDGSDLGVVLKEKGPMGVEDAVDCVVQACEALAEAHSAGIVHRDLKPSNLFLIKRLDGSASIKLIDFGISKIQLPGADGAEGEMTATAVMMGSPLYMAPEQMASARDVDGRADIWSLGIILHTMLTGSPPFRAPSVMQVYELIVAGAPPIRKTRPEVPETIEAAILKCLQKDRRQRFANVGELADAIADNGPPQTRFAADRIKRIVAARAQSDSQLPPSGSEAHVPVVAITPASSIAGAPAAIAEAAAKGTAPAPAASDGSSQPGGASVIDPLGTDGAWDQKTHPPVRRARPAALIAAVAVLVICAPLAFLALRSAHTPAVAQPAAPSSGPEPVAPHSGSQASPGAAASPADTAAPTVLPGSSVPAASAEAEPSASAAPSSAPTTRPVTEPGVHTHPHVPPPPAHPPRNKGDDLFSTQK